MITNLFSRPPLYKHEDPAQRLLGVAELAPDAPELAALVSTDPAPDVRAAAAERCSSVDALTAALASERDAATTARIAASLGRLLAAATDADPTRALLASDACTDAVRTEVANLTQDPALRAAALDAMRSETELVALALHAGHSDVRIGAAERVRDAVLLQQLADSAKEKDRGVARLVRQRLDALQARAQQLADADAIAAQLEALSAQSGAILSAVVELDRRWQALALADDAERIARHQRVRQSIQVRFDAEQDEQRARVQFERRLRETLDALAPALHSEQFDAAALLAGLETLRAEALQRGGDAALAQIEAAEARIRAHESQRDATARAEALVTEAEQLAAGTSLDSADLQARWQALDLAARPAALTRRFEAAMLAIAQRQVQHNEAMKQQTVALRHRLHGLLHTAEQALTAGQLQAARAAADEMKTIRPGAGDLPKPTAQRLGRLMNQLTEMERWESYGQKHARMQLCERAEALTTQSMEPPKLAKEVQKLRDEWKALDQQHPGVPRSLWQRFDGACEKAYAPASKYFAELSARNKEVRKQRETFIEAAAAHVPTLLGETPDCRAIENWVRDTERTWRDGSLGSLDPASWKKLDARLKAVLAPLREALGSARTQARGGREGIIAEATALAGNANERDTVTRVKALQARWQEQAKAVPLPRRDEQALWEKFRAACDAVFDARKAKRKENEAQGREALHALEQTCSQMEQLAQDKDSDDPSVRRRMREIQEQWSGQAAGAGPALRNLEAKFTRAKAAVDAMLGARVRAREAAVWEILTAKEKLCGDIDAALMGQAGQEAPQADTYTERWTALAALPAAWEKKLLARRDAALRALADPAARAAYCASMEKGAAARRQRLLDLELLLGLDSPPEFQAQRLQVQMQKLKDRFKGASSDSANPASATEQLIAWCADPGLADASDRERAGRILSRVTQMPARKA